MLARLMVDLVQTSHMLQPIREVGEVLGTVLALEGTSPGVNVRVLLQFRAAQKGFATMRAHMGTLLEMDETVHLQIALGFIHFRTGFAFEGAHTDVVLTVAQQLRFADEAETNGGEGAKLDTGEYKEM